VNPIIHLEIELDAGFADKVSNAASNAAH